MEILSQICARGWMYVYYCRTYEKAVSGGRESMCVGPTASVAARARGLG